MRNKIFIGILLFVLILVITTVWYFSGISVSIVSIVVPSEVGTYDSGYVAILLQNNGSKDINVSLKVKNTIEDEKGVSVQEPIIIVGASGLDALPAEVSLKPGINQINVYYGYQLPGLKKIEVEVYQKSKLADAKSVEVNVLPPQIRVELQYTNESQSGYDIYKVFGSLSNFGKGTAKGVAVNISIIDETTGKIVSSATRGEAQIRDYTFFQPMNTWRGKDGLEKQAAVAIIELSSGASSNESYVPALAVAKGKIGNRYKVVVTATWRDQVVSSEMRVPPEDEKVVMKVNPVIDYNPLEGFMSNSEGMFTVIKGSIPEVKESLNGIIVKKAAQLSTFSFNDTLNFVVFRGVFPTGGYGINIDRVEKQGNIYTVYATYRDPGKGIGVTAAFTQPVAIIPIGRLAAGDYESRLKVTKVVENADGTKIIREVIETEKELGVFNFSVKPPEKEETSTAQTQKTNFDMNGTIENITIPCPFNVQCNPQYWLDAEDGNTYHLRFSYGTRLPNGDLQICEGLPALQEPCLTRLPNFGQHIEVIGTVTYNTDICGVNGKTVPCQPIGRVMVWSWQPR